MDSLTFEEKVKVSHLLHTTPFQLFNATSDEEREACVREVIAWKQGGTIGEIAVAAATPRVQVWAESKPLLKKTNL
jgi:hypothetical protein